MSLWRNPEVRKNITLWIILSAAAVAAAFIVDIRCGFTALILCVIYTVLHIVQTAVRYRRISDLSMEIDRILYDCSRFDLVRFKEGELSILYSEIYKMTVRLREQADRLEHDKKYLADSIADISHQIRTPLTSISLVTELMSEPSLDDERRIRYTKELFSLLERIDWLINTLLKISKLDAGFVRFDKKPESVCGIIKQAWTPISVPMDIRGQNFVVNANESLTLECDLAWTVEAVGNILKNCMEHTPDGGTLTVTASDNAVYTCLLIQDNGSGIADEDLPNIFKRFYKGKDSSKQSFGIGLALARMIVVEQGGTIRAYNNKGGGAAFEIRFYKSTV